MPGTVPPTDPLEASRVLIDHMNPELKIDMSLGHDYSLEALDSVSFVDNSLEHYYYPPGNTAGGKDGVTLQVTPSKDSPWLGTFAFGYSSPIAITKAFSLADPAWFVMICSGQGYIVNVHDPAKWKLVESFPISEAYAVVEKDLVIFVDFTKISAYRSEDLAWRTKRLSWDGLTVTEVTPTTVRGVGWDAAREEHVEFEVDLSSGKHDGGPFFPDEHSN